MSGQLSPDRIREMFSRVGAVVTGGHFVYTSKNHGSAYVNKDALFPHTAIMLRLSHEMAEPFRDDEVQTVIGPVVGGALLSQLVAQRLTEMNETQTMAVFADKDGDGLVIKRGYGAHITGKNVLVVEDILNTGGSARATVDVVRASGGMVVGVVALCNRGGVTATMLGDVPKLHTLLDVEFDSFEARVCPLCRDGVPINTEFGHGKQFVAAQKK